MLAVPLLAMALALGGLLACSSESGSESAVAVAPATADLRIVVWPRGKQKAAKPRRWTLRCRPTGGNLPDRERACSRLLAFAQPFRPVPRRAVCTQIYGGPQVAEVRGELRGKRIRSRFTRTDGCQIQRWDRVRFLFRTSSSN